MEGIVSSTNLTKAALTIMKGMEALIQQAFLHVDVIGQHVHEGHYDLFDPSGEIILPQVYESMVKPDWAITMQMWPIPDPAQPQDLPTPPSMKLPSPQRHEQKDKKDRKSWLRMPVALFSRSKSNSGSETSSIISDY
jgi:hypothetical protein